MNKLFVSAIFALLCLAINSYGSKCHPYESVAQALYWADAVFIGKVISVTALHPRRDYRFDSATGEQQVAHSRWTKYINVIEVLAKVKGNNLGRKVILSTGGEYFGTHFTEGQEYLIYAYWGHFFHAFGKNMPLLLRTNHCSRTKARNDAEWQQLLYYRFSPWLLQQTVSKVRFSGGNRSPWAPQE